jgi:hypothetical protein
MTPPRNVCPNCGSERGIEGWSDCPLCEGDDPPDEGDPHEPNDERGWWEDE